MAPPSDHSASRTRLGLAGSAIWAIVVLGVASQNYATFAVKREDLPFSLALLWALNDWIGWLVLAPAVFWLARRFPVERPQAGRNLTIHILFGALVAALHGFSYFLMEWVTNELDDAALSRGQLAVLYTAKNLVFGVLVYGGLVSLSHGIEYYRRYKDRELRATQLLAQLSRAELEVLKMQLQPHFLFNTLHAISALLRPDPDAADRIITRLGDLLRMSLSSNGAQEVPLTQELEFVEKYADIQRTRFRDRLSIRIDAEPAALPALVPSLILQPLVENSIRHGVERREASARIEVRARKAGDRLLLTVTDDGPGFPEEILTPVPGRGLGLANTRARIAALYGETGRIEIGSVASGGAIVTLNIPFRIGSHGAV
jgi:two-component system LytT family sensor kinase